MNEIKFGDAYELIKQVPDKSVDLIITDPPYEFETQGGGMLKEKRIKNMMDDLKEHDLNKGINYDLLDELMRVMKKPNIYIWCNKAQMYDYMNYFIGKQKCNFDLIVWHKSNAMPLCGGKYLSDCEYCLYFYKGVKLNTTYETASKVYNLAINVEDKKLYKHPTIKPLGIVKNLVINSSERGGVILDPFVGSGTTCVAAKELGRQYLGFEINEEYYKIAVDRLNGINQKGEMDLFNTDFDKLEQGKLF